MKKAFTLVEMIVVILVVWVLFTLLAKVYITSSKLYIYQKHMKNVEKDILFFNQNLQNLVDNTELDYSKYPNLENTLWFTWNLYLTWNGVGYKLYLSWKNIFMDKTSNWTTTNVLLTNSGAIEVKSLKFKIIPFKDPYDIAWYGANAMQPFVKVFMEIQNNYYRTWSWENAVNYKFEESFNFKYFKN